MKQKLFNIEDVLKKLRREVETHGSQEAFAERAGISQQYVGDILRRQRAPGRKILHALGLEKTVVYTEIPKYWCNKCDLFYVPDPDEPSTCTQCSNEYGMSPEDMAAPLP